MEVIVDTQDLDEIVAGLMSVFPAFSKKVSIISGAVLASEPITRTHLRMLRLLELNGAMSMGDLGHKLAVTKPNVTVLTDKLTALDLVSRCDDGTDRRVVHIDITPIGRKYMETMLDKIRFAIEKACANYTPSEIALFKTTLCNMDSLLEKFNI
jgi:DNA-binding MarR family transcriptional regulator